KGDHGTDEITRTSLSVPSDAALDYWMKRLNRLNVKHQGIQEQFGKKVLPFVDFDDQQYQLISDANNTGEDTGNHWEKGLISLEYVITWLEFIVICFFYGDYFKDVL